jgi:hypothetical protein
VYASIDGAIQVQIRLPARGRGKQEQTDAGPGELLHENGRLLQIHLIFLSDE